MDGKSKILKSKKEDSSKDSLIKCKKLRLQVGEYVWCSMQSSSVLGKMAHASEEEIPESLKKASRLDTILIRLIHDST